MIVNHGVTQLMEDIDTLGHKTLRLNSDGQPALVAIQEEVRKQKIDETLLEQFAWRRWRVKWNADRAVQSVAEQVRVLRAAPVVGSSSAVRTC